jgi:hypothetical protein
MAALADDLRLPGFAQRQHGMNDRFHPALVDQPGDSGELLAVRLDEDEGAAHAMSSAAVSSVGGLTIETRMPPGFNTDQDRS